MPGEIEESDITDSNTKIPAPSDEAGFIAALRATSWTTLLTIALGVVTNKMIAVEASADGVALIGVYRTLSGLIVAVLSIGTPEVIGRRLSTRGGENPGPILAAVTALYAGQVAAALAASALLAPGISSLIFGTKSGEHLLEIHLVTALTAGVLGMQNSVACLNGLMRVRESNRVSLATSIATALTVYPLLRFGNVGLSMVIGGTCFVGAGVGAWYAWVGVPRSRAARFPRSWKAFHESLPLSPWLMINPLASAGAALGIQTLINRHYGGSSLHPLGHYNAASMLETTSVLLLTSPMRPYFFPRLGTIPTLAGKKEFAYRTLRVLLVLLLAGGGMLITGAPLILRLLFDPSFTPAASLVRVLALSMVPQLFMWYAALFLIHHGDYRTMALTETVRFLAEFGAVALCVGLGLPLIGVAWAHLACAAISAVAYGVLTSTRYGGAIVRGPGMVALGMVLSVLGALAWLVD